MLDNIKHDRSITLRTLDDLCETLDCDISDIIEYTKSEKGSLNGLLFLCLNLC